MYNEPTEIWEKQNWDATREQELMRYINGKDKYWLFISEDKNKIPFQEYVKLKKIDLNKPIIGMLTNVIWDAQVFYEARVFEDMITWINKTINYFSKRTDLQLLIRVHPAEAMPMNRQPVVAEIKKAFENLPPNVFIIDAEDTVSTFEAIDHCNAAIIYATTAGIELAAKGKPVIVAGEAWIKNKNISYDPTSEIEYFQLLDKLPFISMLSEEKIIRAKKYAYYFYFNRMIHLSCLSKEDDSFRLNSLEDLLPGVDPGLDVICKSILKKLPFLYS